MGDKEAFGLAVIEAGEEVIGVVGETATTTAGKMAMLEKAVKDASDMFKETYAEEMANEIDDAAVSAGELATALTELAIVGGTALAHLIRGGNSFCCSVSRCYPNIPRFWACWFG